MNRQLYSLIGLVRKNFLDVYMYDETFRKIVDTAYQTKDEAELNTVLLTGIRDLLEENSRLHDEIQALDL